MIHLITTQLPPQKCKGCLTTSYIRVDLCLLSQLHMQGTKRPGLSFQRISRRLATPNTPAFDFLHAPGLAPLDSTAPLWGSSVAAVSLAHLDNQGRFQLFAAISGDQEHARSPESNIIFHQGLIFLGGVGGIFSAKRDRREIG